MPHDAARPTTDRRPAPWHAREFVRLACVPSAAILLVTLGLAGVQAIGSDDEPDGPDERLLERLPERARMQWRNADANGDGVLTRAEIPDPGLFARLDGDGDGRITLPEMLEAGRRDREARRATLDERVRVVEDVSYTPDAPHRLRTLDLYLPATDAGDEPPAARRRTDVERLRDRRSRRANEPAAPSTTKREVASRPIVVYVHGGGWRIGDKAAVADKPTWCIDAGWAFASVNYRLSPDVAHPAHVEDVAAAIAWIHEHAEAHGIDADRIVLMGHSAGAHLVSLVATDPTHLAAHGLSPTDLRGVVSLDTASHDVAARADRPAMRSMIRSAFGDDPEVHRAASPLHHVAEGRAYPAFLLPYAGTRADARRANESFAAALRAVGADAEVVEGVGKDHGGVNRDASRDGDAMAESIRAFIERVVADVPSANEGDRPIAGGTAGE